jgi:broad specificity phosphatase PhoE
MFTLIRHNRLKAPYDDYSKLSLDDLEKLASCEMDPSIQEFVMEDTKGFDPSMVLDADVLLCSESTRSRETLELLLKLLEIDKEIMIEPLINEISFSPKKLIGDSDKPLERIRSEFVSGLYDEKSGSEQSNDIKKRIESLKHKYKGKKVFGVSHGFFMGFWSSIYGESIEPESLQRVDYLEVVKLN